MEILNEIWNQNKRHAYIPTQEGLCIFVGDAGCGKSTLVNYMLSRKVVENSSPEIASFDSFDIDIEAEGIATSSSSKKVNLWSFNELLFQNSFDIYYGTGEVDPNRKLMYVIGLDLSKFSSDSDDTSSSSSSVSDEEAEEDLLNSLRDWLQQVYVHACMHYKKLDEKDKHGKHAKKAKMAHLRCLRVARDLKGLKGGVAIRCTGRDTSTGTDKKSDAHTDTEEIIMEETEEEEEEDEEPTRGSSASFSSAARLLGVPITVVACKADTVYSPEDFDAQLQQGHGGLRKLQRYQSMQGRVRSLCLQAGAALVFTSAKGGNSAVHSHDHHEHPNNHHNHNYNEGESSAAPDGNKEWASSANNGLLLKQHIAHSLFPDSVSFQPGTLSSSSLDKDNSQSQSQTAGTQKQEREREAKGKGTLHISDGLDCAFVPAGFDTPSLIASATGISVTQEVPGDREGNINATLGLGTELEDLLRGTTQNTLQEKRMARAAALVSSEEHAAEDAANAATVLESQQAWLTDLQSFIAQSTGTTGAGALSLSPVPSSTALSSTGVGAAVLDETLDGASYSNEDSVATEADNGKSAELSEAANALNAAVREKKDKKEKKEKKEKKDKDKGTSNGNDISAISKEQNKEDVTDFFTNLMK